jgi:Na+/melibiose symporter-like transporter
MKYRSEEDIKDFRKNPFGYISYKVLNFFSYKNFFKLGSTKQKLKALLIKLLILYIIIIITKMFYYKIANRTVDSQYKETLRLFKELKAQNEEILKNNQIIMEENVRLRSKKNSN